MKKFIIFNIIYFLIYSYTEAENLLTKNIKMINPLKIQKSIIIKEGITLSPEERGAVTAEVSAVLKKWMVEEHERVKKGQTVALLETLDYEIAVEQAKSALAALEAQFVGVEKEYKRGKELYEQGALPKQQFETIEAQYNSLNKQIESAKNNVALITRRLEKTTIKAPYDGEIISKKLPLGYSIVIAMPGSGDIAEIAKINRLKVSMNISEVYYNEINKGDDIEFFIPSLNKTLKSKIYSKGSTINDLKKFNIISYIDNEKYEVPAGIFAIATIESPLKERIVVPPTSIKMKEDKIGEIYTVKDGKILSETVYIGFTFEEGVEVIGNIPELIVKDASSVRVGEIVNAYSN